MKKMKNLLSLVLALVMVMAMTLTAMASEGLSSLEGPFEVTIDNQTPGHTYEAYQIFSGNLAKETVFKEEKMVEQLVLSNIVWGTGIKGDEADQAGLLAALKTADTRYAECSNASDVAKVLGELGTDGAKEFAKIVAPYLAGPTGSSTENMENGKTLNYTISGLPAGYYLIQDKAGTLDGDNDAYTEYIMEVLANESVNPKSDVPTVEKKVKEKDDSTNVVTDWQDDADYDIGDVVPFQLTGTLPSDISVYKNYKYVFHDVQSEGLTFDSDSVKVTINGEEVPKEVPNPDPEGVGSVQTYTVSSITTDGCTFEVEFVDIKMVCEAMKIDLSDPDVVKNVKVVVEYNATLNDKAVIGENGNDNKVKLEFSNNPNGEGTGETPEDRVVVFTFELDVYKVYKAGEDDYRPLAGAEFKLEKWVVDAKNPDGVWTEVQLDKDRSNETEFYFKGLDDGQYRLTETETPVGYNKIDPIYFVVASEVDEKLDLTHLTFTQTDNKWVKSDDPTANFVPGPKTGGIKAGFYYTDIVNMKGVTLPETGGIGTTIFTVSGIILVIIAGVLLVTKKRMSKEQ